MWFILRSSLPKWCEYTSIQGSWSPLQFIQYSQRRRHPQLLTSPWFPYRRPPQPRIIHRQTCILTQLQRLSHWWHRSYSKTLQWWRNSKSNCLPHWLLPHRWLWHTKSSVSPFLNGVVIPRQTTLPRTSCNLKFQGILFWRPRLDSKEYSNQTPECHNFNDMFSSLPRSISSMFLNYARFAFGWISMLSFFSNSP